MLLPAILIYASSFLIFINPENQNLQFKDSRDDQVYSLLEHDNLLWFSENLNYKTKDSECFEGIENNCDQYGQLYNWKDAKSACPKGWRLPTIVEWKDFYKSHSSEGIFAFMNTTDSLWTNNEMNTNSSSFNALPAGMKVKSKFRDLGISANFWTFNPSKPLPYHFHIYGLHESSSRTLKKINKMLMKAKPIKHLNDAWLLEENNKTFVIVKNKNEYKIYYSHTPHIHADWKSRMMSVRCVCEKE